MRRLLDSLPTACLLLDARGTIRHVNPRGVALLGAPDGASCVGRGLGEVVAEPALAEIPDPGDGEGWSCTVASGTGGRTEGAIVLSATRSDEWLPGGTLVAMTPSTSPGAGEPESPHEGERLYLSVVTHELRTPLGAILGLAGTLDATELSLNQRHLVRTLEDSARGMSQLLDGAFDLARLRDGTLKPVSEEYSVPDVVESVAFSMSGRAAEKEIEVSVAVDPDVPWLMVGDGRLVRQLLLNLTGNAIKFTERGGVHLEVSLGPATDDGGRVVVFDVRDTGPGIEPGIGSRIFEPFVQGDRAARQSSGSGLGLAVVRGAVEQLGGTIEVESTPGEGSCFTMRLPHGPVDRECPRRRLSDRAWPETTVLVCGGTGHLHRGISMAVDYMRSHVEVVSPGDLAERAAGAETSRLLVLLDGTLGHDTLAGLALATAESAPSGVDVEVVVMLAPGEEAVRSPSGDPLPTLLKPVVRRRLGALMSPDSPVVDALTDAGPLRILVVEDDRAIRLFYRHFLARTLDAEVTEASTVAEALTLVDPPPRLGLIDLSLPDGHGTEVARALRERFGRDVLLIVTSGYHETRVDSLVRDGTFDAFLPKPSTLAQVETLIGDLLARSSPPARPSAADRD